MLENLRSGKIISHWDSATTWFKTLKNLCATNVDSYRLALILCALLTDNAGALEFALKEHKNADTLLSSNADFTALMLAADWGSAECVKVLLEAYADVNAKDGDNNTILMRAAESGNAECVKLLLAAKMDVEAKNSNGMTALMWAAHKGKTKCVKALLEAGADVNARNSNGWTALMIAAINGRTECVKALLEAKAEINAKDKDSWTALMFAAINGRTECVKALLEEGADWQLRTRNGNRAVDLVWKDLCHSKNKTTNDEVYRILHRLDENLAEKRLFWDKCYSSTNIVIAVIFVAWVSISIWQKWSIDGSGIDITLYIIGCLVPLIFKAYLSYRANNYRPDNMTACIAYGVTDFFCAMALCLPAISNKILDSFSGVVWLSMLVQLAIAVFLGYKFLDDFANDLSLRTICVWNVIITITLFYMGGAVMTGGYDFLSNMRAILTLGY